MTSRRKLCSLRHSGNQNFTSHDITRRIIKPETHSLSILNSRMLRGEFLRNSLEKRSNSISKEPENFDEVDTRSRHEDSTTDDTSSSSGSESQVAGEDTAKNDDQTFALNYNSSGPSEVIVKGTNGSKIRLKFPQRSEEPIKSARTHTVSANGFKRQGSVLSITSGQEPQEHGDDCEYEPLSQPEPKEKRQAPLPSIVQNKPESQTFQRDSMYSGFGFDLGFHSSSNYDSNLDSKVKRDIFNGIEYFERKAAEMKEINNKMGQELERLTRINHQLEDKLQMASEKNESLKKENDELKIRLDQKEKEFDQQKTQTMEHWKAKIKTEEMFYELRRDNELEMKTLKEKLESKEKELHQYKNSKDKSVIKKSVTDGHQLVNNSLKANMEEHLELLHKIALMEQEIAKLKAEKESVLDNGRKNEDEVDGMRSKLREHSSEIEAQHKRFLSLKKSFNNLMEENEKLKSQLLIRTGKKTATSININNNTWPKNLTDKKGDAENTTAGFAVPFKITKGQPANLTKPVYTHRRAPSDGKLPDSLPPVNK